MGVKKKWNLSVPKPGAGDKTYWQNIGKMMEMDDGRISIKLDAMPVGMISGKNGPEPFDGWIKVFPDEDRGGYGGQSRSGTGSGQSRSQGSAAGRMGGDVDLDDEIPF